MEDYTMAELICANAALESGAAELDAMARGELEGVTYDRATLS